MLKSLTLVAGLLGATTALAQQADLDQAPPPAPYQAVSDLVQLPVAVFPFEPLGDRVWELHTTVTAYDAVYVALAEVLDAPLWTLDRRLAAAPGPRCAFRTPA